jgi:hypothetical protein
MSDTTELPVEVLGILRQVAWGPKSGNDHRCAFCDAFPSESNHRRYSQAGSIADCLVIAARKILKDRGEHVEQYEA